MQTIEVQQGSNAWFEARAGAATASMFSTIRDLYKVGANKGGYKAATLDYAFRLAAERVAGEPLQDEQFESYAMRRGHELEPEARSLHALVIQTDIERVGIALTDDGHFGASADGFIGPDGGAEYKCLVSAERLRAILFGGDLSEFKDQIQGCMWITGRTWWDFVLYCPSLRIVGLDIHIVRMQRDDDYIEALESDMLTFDQHVQAYEAQIRKQGKKSKRPGPPASGAEGAFEEA